MSGNRIVYQNWIAERGAGAKRPTDDGSADAAGVNDDEIYREVRKALQKLTEDESEFIVRFYYMGESYREISEKSARTVHRLASLHKRALKKLRRSLAGFVAERFKIDAVEQPDCPLCSSPHREAIDKIIGERDKTAPWKPVIADLRREFGLKISSPQVLIGHEKYH